MRTLFIIGITLVSTHSNAQSLCFDPASHYNIGVNAASLVSKDFDSDGKKDLAVLLRPTSGTGSMALLSGTGTGSFGTAVSFSVGAVVDSYPRYITSADFNGDAIQDLAIAGGLKWRGCIIRYRYREF